MSVWRFPRFCNTFCGARPDQGGEAVYNTPQRKQIPVSVGCLAQLVERRPYKA